MFGFIKNWLKPKKSIEEIKAEMRAEREAFTEKMKYWSEAKIALESWKELSKVDIKAPDAIEQIVYFMDKIYLSGIDDAKAAMCWYLERLELKTSEAFMSRLFELWRQTKSYKLAVEQYRLNSKNEDF